MNGTQESPSQVKFPFQRLYNLFENANPVYPGFPISFSITEDSMACVIRIPLPGYARYQECQPSRIWESLIMNTALDKQVRGCICMKTS